jgi:hypothetical protein
MLKAALTATNGGPIAAARRYQKGGCRYNFAKILGNVTASCDGYFAFRSLTPDYRQMPSRSANRTMTRKASPAATPARRSVSRHWRASSVGSGRRFIGAMLADFEGKVGPP